MGTSFPNFPYVIRKKNDLGRLERRMNEKKKQSRQDNESLIVQRMEFGTETKIKLAFG